MTEPKFYTRNFVTEDAIFTVSHNSADIANLYDRDNLSQWISVGADDDADEISIEVEFEAQDIDTVMVVNHNLADITVEYWNGSSYAAWASASSITDDFTKLTGTLRNTTKIKLTASATQTPDEDKAIGELIACALALDLGRDLKSYEVNARERVTLNNLGDGSIHQVLTLFSTNRTQKYEARCQVQYLPQAKLEALLALKESGDPLIWQPESVQRPDQVFLVLFMGPIKYSYSDSFKNAGYTVNLDLREV